MKIKKKIRLISGVALFVVYFFYAARSVPLETVMIPRWLSSTETGTPIALNESLSHWETLIPFELGNRFGHVSPDGVFSINREKNAHVSLSHERWAEYEAEPERITVHHGEVSMVIDNPRGYPFFLAGSTFLINSEQNAISAVSESGDIRWTYEFAAPLTCIDSTAGLFFAGTLDGVTEVLDSGGRRVFSFEPGGSRYAIITGCAISRDGSRLAVISGIDSQRFLILERFGSNSFDYKVVYHEFLGEGFRRPVYVSFIENDRWVVFERNGGLGFYDIKSREISTVALNGDIRAVDHSGGQGVLFTVISRDGNDKTLAGIRLPGQIIIESPFKSESIFLGRVDSRLIVGGGQTLIAFDLEKR